MAHYSTVCTGHYTSVALPNNACLGSPTGTPARDYVKLVVEEDAGKRIYFARCVCFFVDKNLTHFVAVRWLTEVPGAVLDPASRMAPFTMSPEGAITSYSVMPATAILNGALVVPSPGRLWALMSPREERQYIAHNYMNSSVQDWR